MKNKRQLTENDVYSVNSELIREVCKKYGKSLEPEDREAIANLGMIYAIRTYRRGVSEFRPYAIDYIRKTLQLAEYDSRSMKRIECQLSLDMHIKSCESSTTYVEMCIHPNSNFISSILTCDFILHLEMKLRYFAILCIGNYSIEEIAEHMNIPISEIEQLKITLQCKWKEYDK